MDKDVFIMVENNPFSGKQLLKSYKTQFLGNGHHLYHNGFRVDKQEILDLHKVGIMANITDKQQERGFNRAEFVSKIEIIYTYIRRAPNHQFLY
ncbi:MAG: hypothetical protein ACQETL_12920 [Bacteroidota bacterium]